MGAGLENLKISARSSFGRFGRKFLLMGGWISKMLPNSLSIRELEVIIELRNMNSEFSSLIDVLKLNTHTKASGRF